MLDLEGSPLTPLEAALARALLEKHNRLEAALAEIEALEQQRMQFACAGMELREFASKAEILASRLQKRVA